MFPAVLITPSPRPAPCPRASTPPRQQPGVARSKPAKSLKAKPAATGVKKGKMPCAQPASTETLANMTQRAGPLFASTTETSAAAVAKQLCRLRHDLVISEHKVGLALARLGWKKTKIQGAHKWTRPAA